MNRRTNQKAKVVMGNENKDKACFRCGNVRHIVARGLCNSCYVYFSRLMQTNKTMTWKSIEDGEKCLARVRVQRGAVAPVENAPAVDGSMAVAVPDGSEARVEQAAEGAQVPT